MATRRKPAKAAAKKPAAKKVGESVELPGPCLVSAPDNVVTTGRTSYKFRVAGEHRVIVEGDVVETYDVAELEIHPVDEDQAADGDQAPAE